MTTYKVMNLFEEQLRRISDGTRFKTKVVVTPSSVDEAGVVFKLSLLKTRIDTSCPATGRTRTIRFRLSVSGTAESMTGLEQACEAIEALDEYFIQDNLRLEEIVEGENSMTAIRKIPNTRITQRVSEDESFVPNPDSTDVQDVEDVRTITITVPK